MKNKQVKERLLKLYEDDETTELKVTFTYQRNGVLPL